jgi:hypothetical protein
LNKIFITAIAGILVLVIVYAWIVLDISSPVELTSLEKTGAFGDSFGIITALFSGLAFAGIVYTILLQKEELGLQRKELELTQEVLEKQVEVAQHQNFENTFFQMLRLFNDIVTDMDIGENTSGRDCFEVFHDRFMRKYKFKKRNHSIQENEWLEMAYRDLCISLRLLNLSLL